MSTITHADRLGFRPAFFDTATFSIHSVDGLPDDLMGARAVLVPGFERNGFFYTRTAAARAIAEWTQPTDAPA